jgi:hypothetical protein
MNPEFIAFKVNWRLSRPEAFASIYSNKWFLSFLQKEMADQLYINK